MNHPTVGRIPNGGTVERDTAVDLSHLTSISLMLRDSDFTAARDIASTINHQFGKEISTVIDGRMIKVATSGTGATSLADLISQIQNLSIAFHPPAKVVLNERTGTIVMGGDVKLSAVSVLHGTLSVEVTTQGDDGCARAKRPGPGTNGEKHSPRRGGECGGVDQRPADHGRNRS
jgi:flagellar P-ring protein precursor FlgI